MVGGVHRAAQAGQALLAPAGSVAPPPWGRRPSPGSGGHRRPRTPRTAATADEDARLAQCGGAAGRQRPARCGRQTGWKSNNFPGDDATCLQKRPGLAVPLKPKQIQPLRPGEDCAGEDNRLGADAARLWFPTLCAEQEARVMAPPIDPSSTAARCSLSHHGLGGQRRHRQDFRSCGPRHPLHRRGRGDAGPDAAHLVQPRGNPGVCVTGSAARSPTRWAASPNLKWPRNNEIIDPSARPERRRKNSSSAHSLLDALAGFDAATIATIHQFCNLVLHPRWVWPATATSGVDTGGEPRGSGHRGRRRSVPVPYSAGNAISHCSHTRHAISWPAQWSATLKPSCGRSCPPPGSRAGSVRGLR